MNDRETTLEDLLRGITDRRVLVLAASACGRTQLPRLEELEPYNRTIFESAESWSRGQLKAPALREKKTKAKATRGGLLSLMILELCDAKDAELPARIDKLVAHLAAAAWTESDAGKAWLRADPKHRTIRFQESPEATKGMVAARSAMTKLVREIVGSADPIDVEACLKRHKDFVDRTSKGPKGPAPSAPRKTTVSDIPIAVEEGALRPARKSDGDAVLIEAISKHLTQHVGRTQSTYNDKDLRWVRLDIHIVHPTEPGDSIVLCTSGMAERPLKFPGSERSTLWTEMVMVLPGHWELDDPSLGDPENFWPLGWLRFLARQAHKTGVALNAGETTSLLSAPDVPRPTPFEGVALIESTRVPSMKLVGREVGFLAVVPLHANEIERARSDGFQTVIEAMKARGVDPEVIDPERKSVF